jgi:hypothetical protein
MPDAKRSSVTLLGGFAAEASGEPVPDSAWRLRKARELVKLLALADGHRLHREQAMDALWPDRDSTSAANNLNQAVHAARRALGSDAITLLDGLLRLEAEVDAELFERAASEAQRERTARACVRALALYRGELLPENRYDDWASLERERLADLHAELEQLLSELGGARRAVPALPAETSTFVGRDHELGELAALLAHTRLLTLTGVGGVGKTRLALELGRRHEDAYANGGLLVELDSLDDGALVPSAVAEALDLQALRGGAMIEALRAELEHVSRRLQPGDPALRAALEADRFAPREAADVGGHRLQRADSAHLLEAQSHGLGRAAARAHAEHDAAGSQLVQGEDGAGRHRGVARMRHGDPGPELDPPGPEHAGGEGDPELPAHEVRVGHPHRLEAQLLGELDLLDDFGSGLGGENAQVEFHAGIIAEAD